MGKARSAHVLLGVSGAIAAYKSADIVRGLRSAGAEVTVALTANAERFVTPFLLGNLAGRRAITDQYDGQYHDIHHIDLAFEVDALLVAPATADIIAKMAHGIADDFVTTFYLATAAPVLIAPAMNTRMWEHPATVANVATLRGRGVRVVGPVEGELATFHRGLGRLAEPSAIVAAVTSLLAGEGPLRGHTVLVTAGRTEEDLDLVRTLTNRSSGRMGYELARAAQLRGARTILISGPSELEPPLGVELVKVRSAEQMHKAVRSHSQAAQVIIMCAAVSDFRPDQVISRKVKKDEEDAPEFRLVRTVDILAELGQDKGDRILVGFAAEDTDVEARALGKLKAKGLDLIVGNDISGPQTGFAAEDNEVILLGADGLREVITRRPKREVAGQIVARIERLVEARR